MHLISPGGAETPRGGPHPPGTPLGDGAPGTPLGDGGPGTPIGDGSSDWTPKGDGSPLAFDFDPLAPAGTDSDDDSPLPAPLLPSAPTEEEEPPHTSLRLITPDPPGSKPQFYRARFLRKNKEHMDSDGVVKASRQVSFGAATGVSQESAKRTCLSFLWSAHNAGDT